MTRPRPTYVYWQAPFELDTDDDGEVDCTDDEALIIVEIAADESYTVLWSASCGDAEFLVGCDYSADDVCQSCGECTPGDGELVCETDLACE